MALRRNILIFHQGALGDFIVTWPLALALARLHPQSRVFYVTPGHKGALAERVIRVESMDSESGGWHRLFSAAPDLPAAASRALAGAHTVLSFLAEPDDRWSRNVIAANPDANLLTVQTTAPEEFAEHQAEFLADQLHVWPAAESAVKQILHSIADRGLAAGPMAGGPVVIHPGGGAAKKCWAADRYLALARRLAAQGRSVKILLGEVELERWPAETIDAFRASAEVQTPATLLELHSHLSAASAFIGNDSGPGHLAGILAIPTLSLFGEASNPQRWKPLGPRVKVIHSPLDELQVDTVLDGVAGMIG